MKYEVPKETLQAVLDYLARRPYAEVFQLVSAIQVVKEIKEDKTIEKEKDDVA